MTDSHDLVLYGATSFAGQITARYLFDNHGLGLQESSAPRPSASSDGSSGSDIPAARPLRWAIAGRSKAKLEQVRSGLGPEAADLPIIVADASDPVALRQMVDAASVVVSTVGPYALYGSDLVAACAETGTHYADLAGEAPWIQTMIDAHHDAAVKSGAWIVNSCGFDSIPSDMGVHHLQQAAMEQFGQPATKVTMRVKALKGGLSGGTVASMMNMSKEVASDPSLRKVLGNPFALRPEGDRTGPRQPSVTVPTTDPEFGGAVIAPFVMESINSRIVHRSNALTGDAYGRDFVYSEAMLMGKGPAGWAKAAALTAGLGSVLLGAALPPTRWLLEKVVPAPGEGPSPEAQAAGFYDIRFLGTTADGHEIRTKVTGDMDPGYGSTAKMLGEAGVCLAKDVPARAAAPAGGILTPASILGDDLLARLTANAGLTFEVL